MGLLQRTVVALAGLVALASCGGAGTSKPPPPPLWTYPVKVSANGRYLVDQNGKPFLIVGDAPQALMVNISTSDAEMYFADRARNGYNAVWINLLCATYTGGRADASTYNGIVPFHTPNDLSTPNEIYFAHCDAIIRLAAKYGLVVFLDPAETGSFLSVMQSNGVTKCRAYGQYLGNRYKSCDNIVWQNGNDFQSWSDPNSDSVVTAVAQGIKDVDSRHIRTIELDYYLSSSLNDPNWATIVSLNAAYTYYPTYAEVLRDYGLNPSVPVFMVESDYEFENGADPDRLRREEYWAYLSGATGEIYGNGYIWPFKSGWKQNLDTTGAAQLKLCSALLLGLPWQNLVPDPSHTILTAGYGTFASGGTPHQSISDNDYVAAAGTPDGKLFLAYLPNSRTVTVDLTKMSGPVTAQWFDPTNGQYQAISGSPFANTGSQDFPAPGTNSDGSSTDWVLVLQAN